MLRVYYLDVSTTSQISIVHTSGDTTVGSFDALLSRNITNSCLDQFGQATQFDEESSCKL